MTGFATPDDTLAGLFDHSVRSARAICRSPAGAGVRPTTRYLLAEARRLLDAYEDGGGRRPDVPAADALDAVVDSWPALCAGTITGDEVYSSRPALWHRLMDAWPMGTYAELVAAALSTVDVTGCTVVELGAGVGATTRRIQADVRRRGGRLIATDRAYRGPRAVDFDRRLVDQIPRADVLVGTNALHCASAPEQSLRWAAELLPASGTLVLGEGAPEIAPGVPWPLNLAFGPCHGWFDRGGFRTRPFWIDAFAAAGFEDVTFTGWPNVPYELGGVYVGRRAA